MVKLTSFILSLYILLATTTSQSSANTLVASDVLTAQTKRIVVFVPGFFNSFAPEYFSKDIVTAMQKKGFTVVIAQNLNPVGTVEENGDRVLYLLQTIRSASPSAQISVIGHSAGGLYALYAINKGARDIKTLVTVSTPFNGVGFVENWRENSFLFKTVMDWARLDGLRQLTTPFVQQFLRSLRVPSSLKIYAYGGYQPVKADFTDAANMSVVLSVTDHFTSGPSDGIVSFASALYTTAIPTTEKTLNYIHVNKSSYIALEHWEQVLDYRHFYLLGVRNSQLIRDRQIQFYSGIGAMLLYQ